MQGVPLHVPCQALSSVVTTVSVLADVADVVDWRSLHGSCLRAPTLSPASYRRCQADVDMPMLFLWH